MKVKTVFTVRCYNPEILRQQVKEVAKKAGYSSSNTFILAAIQDAIDRLEVRIKVDEASIN